MFHRRFLGIMIALLIIFGLIMAGGAAAQRNAWMQGYLMGRLATGTDGAAASLPPLAYGGYGWGYGPHFGGPHFGGLLGFLLIGGIVFLVLGGLRRIRMMHGPWGPGMWEGGSGQGTPGQSDDPARPQAWRGRRRPGWGPTGDTGQADRPHQHGDAGSSRYV